MTEKRERIGSCPSGKRAFRSRAIARRWIRSVPSSRFKKQKARPYRCDICEAWHVTTSPTGRVTYYREERSRDGRS